MKAFEKILLVWSIVSLLLVGCSDQNKQIESISITWEIISNTQSDQPTAKCVFTITNTGKKELKSDWELYFNQSPRKIVDAGVDSIGLVKHISGDWFKISPNKNLILRSGDKVNFLYETEYWFIKESDAPTGLYFVANENNREIIEVQYYTITPFSRSEQVSRHTNDYYPLPTPQNSFNANQELSVLPEEKLHRVLPSPKNIMVSGEKIVLSPSTIIVYNNPSIEFEANYLATQFKSLLDWDLEITASDNDCAIKLKIDESKGFGLEEYALSITENGVCIEASHNQGLFYGIQSLLSLLPIESILHKTKKIELPVLEITDSPRFGYRGIHIDVVRHFFPKETLKKIIDILAYYKINTLHLHLTDDEGWRIEIASLPELTSVGGQRGHTAKDAAALHPAYGSGPHPFVEGKSGSGFYTRQDFIEILQYAKDRHIRVIPEINLPGHARAAIKAMEARYYFYMAKGDEVAANDYRLIDPDDQSVYLSAQFYNDNVINVAKESTYRFFEAVIDEIVDIYSDANATLDILHVGGDEVPKGAWTKSPMVDELMKQHPDIMFHENMHAYFTERTLEILKRKGLKMAGWEEIALHNNNGQMVNPKFATGNVIPYVWNSLWGAQDLAYRLANRGYPVIMCHVTNFYFDLAYSNHPKESGLYWGGFVNTRNAWYYNPFDIFKTLQKDNFGRQVNTEVEYKHMERLKPEARKNILGLQAQLWSETIQNPEMLEYSLLPKLIGFSETAWAKERRWEAEKNKSRRENIVKEEWNTFANSLAQRELPRLAFLFGGYNYRIPPPGAKIENSKLFANVAFLGLIIRYTTDGSEPNQQSSEYISPVKIDGKILKLKAFDRAGNFSRTVELNQNNNGSSS